MTTQQKAPEGTGAGASHNGSISRPAVGGKGRIADLAHDFAARAARLWQTAHELRLICPGSCQAERMDAAANAWNGAANVLAGELGIDLRRGVSAHD